MASYAVAGVTGRVGSVVASELLNRGRDVTAIVRTEGAGRDWAARGAAVAVGSLDNSAFLQSALKGAAGFFTLLPENVPPDDFHAHRRWMADAMCGAIADSGVPHVVALSAIAAVLPAGNGPAQDLHYFEQQLGRLACDVTVLRACYFQDNVAGVLPAAVENGVYPNFLASADAPVPMVATRDVGRFAAEALLVPSPGRDVVDVLGPAYSIRQVARALGTALGRELHVVDIPPERHSDSLVAAGVPRPIADAVAEMFAAFNAGMIAPRAGRQLMGKTTIDEVIAQCLRASADRTTA